MLRGCRGLTGNASGGVPGLLVTGRYRLAESIGQGGMGRVWRATDEMLDRQVAVKEMRIDGLDPEDTRTRRERTLREARATARIDHPNVVRIYDVVDQGERLWIVMELVAGRSLEQLVVEDGPLDPPAAARIGLELVAALRQVHAGGVLHRDIKPGNVLVERRGHRVVLTDFGIAALQDAEALTMVGMLVGSPDYMAPERVSGRPQGPPSDVWSLGATLCAALGGRSPFSRSTTLATLHAVLYEEPELPSTAGDLGEILAALLEKEPSTRPGLEELETALRRIAFPRPEETESPEAGPLPEPAEGTPEAPEAPGTRETSEAAETREASEAPEASETPVVGGTAEAPDAPEMAETPESAPPPVPPFHQESPTRALLDVSLIRAAQHPRPSGTANRPRNRTPNPTPYRTRSRSPPPHPIQRPNPHPLSYPRPHPPLKPRPRPHPPPSPAHPRRFPNPLPRHAHHGLPRGGHAAGRTPRPRCALRPTPGPAPDGPGGRRWRGDRGNRRRARHDADRRLLPRHDRRVHLHLYLRLYLDLTIGPVDVTELRADLIHRPLLPTPHRRRHVAPAEPAGGRPKEAGLYAWAPPQGWQRVAESGSEVHYTSPDRAQEIVANATPARGDLLAQWQQAEVGTSKGLNYRRIRLERTTFRGAPAVVWEYIVTAKGRLWHVRLLGFRSGGTSYEISTWYHPDIEATALPVYDEVKKSFTPL
ncbi:protein kinase [Streptomyces sp. RLB1-33]